MRKFIALALLFSLTGCATQQPTPKVTPVDLKYCALSDIAGFDDDGLNRSVYAALQQLKVQTGATVAAVEVSDKVSVDAGFQKLVDGKCDAIIASGSELVSSTIDFSSKHSEIKFYSISDAAYAGIETANYTALTFDIYQSAFAAGYLAASETLSENETAVLNLINDAESKKAAKAFAAGVRYYNEQKRGLINVKTITDINQAVQDVVFVLAGNSTKLGEWKRSDTGALKLIKLIGYGRDWYADIRNKELRPYLLTSVIRVDAISKVVDAVVTPSGSMHFDLSNQGVALTPAQDLNWPPTFSSEFDRILKDMAAGKVKVG